MQSFMNRLCFLSCVTSLTSTRGAVVSGPDFDNHVQPVFFESRYSTAAFESAAQLLILSSSLSKMWAWPSLRWTWKSLHNFIDLPGVYRCLRSFYSFRTWLISLILSKCTKSIAPPVAASGNELGKSGSLNIVESLAPSVSSLGWTSYCMHLTCLTKHW
jgi:hypothetical protein